MGSKKSNSKTVIFIKDYTNKKEGLITRCDAVMASHLIQIGVAELYKNDVNPEKEEPIKEETKPKQKKKK